MGVGFLLSCEPQGLKSVCRLGGKLPYILSHLLALFRILKKESFARYIIVDEQLSSYFLLTLDSAIFRVLFYL